MDRLTQKTIGCFNYELKNVKDPKFDDYESFYNYNIAIKKLGELEDKLELKPLDEWSEEHGTAIWWRLPIEEPPYVGSPLSADWTEEYYAHFQELVEPYQGGIKC